MCIHHVQDDRQVELQTIEPDVSLWLRAVVTVGVTLTVGWLIILAIFAGRP